MKHVGGVSMFDDSLETELKLVETVASNHAQFEIVRNVSRLIQHTREGMLIA